MNMRQLDQKELQNSIRVRTRFEDFHKWEDAPDEVAFLRSLHRHEFHVTAKIGVSHQDRQIEFIMYKRWLDQFILDQVKPMPPTKSCEMMATRIIEGTLTEYGDRFIAVEVSEDGENGGMVTYRPDKSKG